MGGSVFLLDLRTGHEREVHKQRSTAAVLWRLEATDHSRRGQSRQAPPPELIPKGSLALEAHSKAGGTPTPELGNRTGSWSLLPARYPHATRTLPARSGHARVSLGCGWHAWSVPVADEKYARPGTVINGFVSMLLCRSLGGIESH